MLDILLSAFHIMLYSSKQADKYDSAFVKVQEARGKTAQETY